MRNSFRVQQNGDGNGAGQEIALLFKYGAQKHQRSVRFTRALIARQFSSSNFALQLKSFTCTRAARWRPAAAPCCSQESSASHEAT